MISIPQPSEIRETKRCFNEIYGSLTSCEKANFHQILNSFKINVTKINWANWHKKKSKANLDKEYANLRFYVKVILLFTLAALPAMSFTIVGDQIATIAIFIFIYLFLFTEVVSAQNSITLLELELDRIDVKIVATEQVIKNTSMHTEISALFDKFFKCVDSDGRFKAKEIYMPSIALAIASNIKSSAYQLDSDVFY